MYLTRSNGGPPRQGRNGQVISIRYWSLRLLSPRGRRPLMSKPGIFESNRKNYFDELFHKKKGGGGKFCQVVSGRPTNIWAAPQTLRPEQFCDKPVGASETASGSRLEGKPSQNLMTGAQLII